MRDRRLTEGGPEPTDWEKAGWKQAPQNGREWRLLRDGKPEPRRVEKDERWTRPFKCRKCGGVKFKVHGSGSKKPVRRCVKCRSAYIKGYYKENRKKYRKYNYRHKEAVESLVVPCEDGWFTLPFSYILRKGGVPITELLQEGRIVVEYMGAPAFAIVPLEDARRLK